MATDSRNIRPIIIKNFNACTVALNNNTNNNNNIIEYQNARLDRKDMIG